MTILTVPLSSFIIEAANPNGLGIKGIKNVKGTITFLFDTRALKRSPGK
jgi:hypothetical protein